jgi:hypothetical protein
MIPEPSFPRPAALPFSKADKYPPAVTGQCAICGREETHAAYLVPKTRHNNKRNKREFDRKTVKQTVGICRPCHSRIHAVPTEKELERSYRIVEALLEHPEVAKPFRSPLTVSISCYAIAEAMPSASAMTASVVAQVAAVPPPPPGRADWVGDSGGSRFASPPATFL